MDWLHYRDAEILAHTLTNRHAPQTISLAADTANLPSEIPTQPKLILPKEGPPSSMHRWYGRIGDRLVVIECEASSIVQTSSVLVSTGFTEAQANLGDWTTLLELQSLPKSIHVSRPLFIESRNSNPSFVVYRPDPQGWKTSVYKASSRADAENLLAFLRKDAWNEACFVGEPESTGKWAIIQGEHIFFGVSSDLDSALRFACERSSRDASILLIVKDITNANSKKYNISQGRVLQLSEE